MRFPWNPHPRFLYASCVEAYFFGLPPRTKPMVKLKLL